MEVLDYLRDDLLLEDSREVLLLAGVAERLLLLLLPELADGAD